MKNLRNKKKIFKILKVSIFFSFVGFILFQMFFGNYFVLGEMFLYDSVPKYNFQTSKFYSDNQNEYAESVDVYNESYQEIEVAGKNDITIYDGQVANNGKIDISKLRNISELRKNFYIVDGRTMMTKDYFDVDKFVSTDLKIKPNGDFPKVLIFHTHSHEMFKDSDTNNLYDGIVGAGERLKQRLEEKGIKCIHNTDRFDVVDGKTKILGAYERMEAPIRKILADNPSIEIVIDLHRDGIDESKKLVTNINGKQVAKIMFFNGICRILKDGKLQETEGLTNPYVQSNLAFSFNLASKAKEKYPNFIRGIYVNAYRYSLHFMPKSTLIEIGAQNNTKEEVFNAVDLLADVIYDVVG